MLVPLLLAPLLLFLLMRVALVDPREPKVSPPRLGLVATVLIGWLPFWLAAVPASPAFNASLCLALSSVLTPVLFAAMATDSAGAWIGDKVFLVVARSLAAAVLAVPLTFLGSWWFIALAAISLLSFHSRMYLWVIMGGRANRYVIAFMAGFLLFVLYWLLVDQSRVTPSTWTNWRGYLFPKSAVLNT